ncbi:hypothetical protein ACFE04_014769 [Oxalis oulophora]
MRRFSLSTAISTWPLPPLNLRKPNGAVSFFCSLSSNDSIPQQQRVHSPLKPGLYLVGTPIGNLEDITLRAIRVLKSANLILSEDTRHSGNDAGMPGISDPGTDLAKACIDENIPVIPIPGPSAFVAALAASGLSTDEFTFVGFLPKHTKSRKERLMVSAKETRTQIFYVPPHKLGQFLEETSSLFGDLRYLVSASLLVNLVLLLFLYAFVMLLVVAMAWLFDIGKFWRGTLGKAKEAFSIRQPKGEITLLIEGDTNVVIETPSDSLLEKELGELISNGNSISMAVKMVAEGKSVSKKIIYSLALKKYGKQPEAKQDDTST